MTVVAGQSRVQMHWSGGRIQPCEPQSATRIYYTTVTTVVLPFTVIYGTAQM